MAFGSSEYQCHEIGCKFKTKDFYKYCTHVEKKQKEKGLGPGPANTRNTRAKKSKGPNVQPSKIGEGFGKLQAIQRKEKEEAEKKAQTAISVAAKKQQKLLAKLQQTTKDIEQKEQNQKQHAEKQAMPKEQTNTC